MREILIAFQSYLYGIEMIDQKTFDLLNESFNRTFMELKYGTKINV